MKSKLASFIFLFACLLSFRAIAYQEAEPQTPTILITEIAYDTWQADALNEWIELLVVSEQPVEAEQYKLGDEETIGGGEGMMRFPKETLLEPGQVIVVAQSAVDFRAATGVYPTFEIIDSTADVPNMRPVSILAKGDIALSNTGDEVIVLNERNRPVDRVSYGDKTTYLDPSIELVAVKYSLERIPPNCDTDTAADFRPQPSPTPFRVPEFGICPTLNIELTPTKPSLNESEDSRIQFEGDAISKIQGNTSTATQVDQTVIFQGIVTAVTADKNASGTTFYTLFVQDSGDGNLETSDAIPIFTGRKPPTVKIGDLVEISGLVTEFFGLTEIDDKELKIKRMSQAHPLPEPILLTQNQPPTEALEGMLVSLPEAIVAGPTFETPAGCGFSVVALDSDPLPLIRHSIFEEAATIVIPVLPNDDRDCDTLPPLKQGDRVFDLIGPLTWNFDQWKIVQQPGRPIRFEVGAPLPLPEKIRLTKDQFSLATLNLENYFDSIDDTGDDSEPKLSAETIAQREKKFAHLISEWMGCPTLIGIQEVEKESLLVSLAAAIEPSCGFTYGVAHRESYDGRGIDNALLFDPRRVKVIDAQLRQSCTQINTGIQAQGFSCPAGQEPLFSRPPFEIVLKVDGQPLVVFVNHFKSKLGGEAETAPRRLAQASFISELIDARLKSGELAIAVIGDFNDYADSATLSKMTEGQILEDVLRRLPEGDQFSFNFGGISQLIDGMLLTSSLAQMATHIQIMHLNADYPDSYQLDLSPQKISLKSTDHDPAIIVFEQAKALQQVNEQLAEVNSKIEDESEKIAIILVQPQTGYDLKSLIYLLPLVVLLISAVSVFIIGRKSKK